MEDNCCCVCYEEVFPEKAVFCESCSFGCESSWTAHKECWEKWKHGTCFTCLRVIRAAGREAEHKHKAAPLAAEIVNFCALGLAMAVLFGLLWLHTILTGNASSAAFFRFSVIPLQIMITTAFEEMPVWHEKACRVTQSALTASIRCVYILI